jgi:hypothetical protein
MKYSEFKRGIYGGLQTIKIKFKITPKEALKGPGY